MRIRYLGSRWDLVEPRGSRSDLGRMLQRAPDAVAAPAGHRSGCHAAPVAIDAAAIGDRAVMGRSRHRSDPFGLRVNSAAKRFIDEGEMVFYNNYLGGSGLMRDAVVGARVGRDVAAALPPRPAEVLVADARLEV